VHVEDTIKIKATVVNNTPNILLYTKECSPLGLSASFDSHVTRKFVSACNIYPVKFELKPGSSVDLVVPLTESYYKFVASSAGPVHAIVTFTYGIEHSNSPPSSISQPFQFSIHPD
jgi:hypothetical protein